MTARRWVGRTFLCYWRDPKGRHDIVDYARAAALILASALAASFGAYLVFGSGGF